MISPQSVENDRLVIAGRSFTSRLLMGSAGFPSRDDMLQSLHESGAEIVTVAMRRIESSKEASFLSAIVDNFFLLPNTAGCYTAKDAILTAELARDALETHWIKLEIIGDDKTLLPDSVELIQAAEALISKGFKVLPYCNDDPVIACRLYDMGCSAVMPLGSPIGSGMGIQNPYNLQLIRNMIPADFPLIVDAGIGSSSDVTQAMELGADAVLVNSAISRAEYPVQMARAMRLAVEAGRLSYLSGRIPRKRYAVASTTMKGIISGPEKSPQTPL